MNKFLTKIHREDIYSNFDEKMMLFNPESNNVSSKVLEEVFGNYNKPEATIIEVGSWKGSSAIAMCNFLLLKNITPTIFCVDTFGGASIHREDDYLFSLMECKNGFPRLYQQFLSNIIYSKLQEYVVPIPHTSLDSFRYLKKLGIIADFCYVDACHEFEEVYQDIKNYFRLVKEGGILFGDDYNQGWPGVVGAVNKFLGDNNEKLSFQVKDSQWIIKK